VMITLLISQVIRGLNHVSFGWLGSLWACHHHESPGAGNGRGCCPRDSQ
jgi:hypothetical protein